MLAHRSHRPDRCHRPAGALGAARQAGTDRLSGVVLAGSGGSGITASGLPTRGLPAPLASGLQWDWFGLLRAAAVAGRRLRTAEQLPDRLIRRYASAPGEPGELVAQVRESFLSSRPRALAATTVASVSHDGVRLAPAPDVPTLVLHGDADPEVPAEEAQALMSALPDAELVGLPGAGHMLPLTHGAFVADQVARWVDATMTETTPTEAR